VIAILTQREQFINYSMVARTIVKNP